jgi:hypothetical protein
MRDSLTLIYQPMSGCMGTHATFKVNTMFENLTPAAITAEQLLSKKSIAIKNQLNSLDAVGLTLVATKGKGQAAKLAGGVVGDLAMANAMAQFKKSNCTNVRPFAVLINSLTSQFTESDSLSPCPTQKAAFRDYPGMVSFWADNAKTEKTKIARRKVLGAVQDIVNVVGEAAQAHYDEQQALKAEAEAAQAEAEAAQALQAAQAEAEAAQALQAAQAEAEAAQAEAEAAQAAIA